MYYAVSPKLYYAGGETGNMCTETIPQELITAYKYARASGKNKDVFAQQADSFIKKLNDTLKVECPNAKVELVLSMDDGKKHNIDLSKLIKLLGEEITNKSP